MIVNFSLIAAAVYLTLCHPVAGLMFVVGISILKGVK